MRRLLNMVLAAVLFGLVVPTVSAELSGGKVRVLVLTNMTGVYSDLAGQGSVIAAEMAAEAMDDAGADIDIEVLSRDSNLDSEQAVDALAAAHEAEPVDMVIGPISSGVAVEVQRWAEQNGILTLHSGPSSSTFTGKDCSPLAAQWGFDTYALSHASASAIVAEGDRRWYFLTADYNFGHDLRKQTQAVVEASGGEVIGESVVPNPAKDVSDELRKAVEANADVIGLANAGDDTQLAIRQAYDVGLRSKDVSLAAIEFYVSDIRSLGLYVTSGLRYATSFYWNRDERSRAWSMAFQARYGGVPTSPQAGVYSATLHYLEAVAATGSDDAATVIEAMRERPVDDGVFVSNGRLRRDGRMLHPMMLVEVASPVDVETARDYLRIIRQIPPEQAFRPLDEGGCDYIEGG